MPLRGALAISNWLCLDDQGRAFAATDDRRFAIVSPAGELERSIGADGNEETWTGVILLLRR